MPETQDILFLLAAGALGGFLSGLLGVGGGIIFIPILDMVIAHYGIEQEMVKFILANSLAVIIFTGIFNSYRQHRAGNFFLSPILYTALPGVLTVLATTWLISRGEWYNKQLFNIVFVVLLVPGVIRMLLIKPDLSANKGDVSNYKFSLVGLFTGVFTAFSGLGGGMIMIPAFVNRLKLEMKKATSVSAGVVPFFALPTVLYYMFSVPPVQEIGISHVGFLIYPVVIPMIVGTLVTVPLGVSVGHRLKERTIKVIFSSFALLVIGKMLIENISKWGGY